MGYRTNLLPDPTWNPDCLTKLDGSQRFGEPLALLECAGMSRIYTKDLRRRILTLEHAAKQSAPCKPNILQDILIHAGALAWEIEEIEELLVAAQAGKPVDLTADLIRRRLVEADRIALTNFGQPFDALLTLPSAELEQLGISFRSRSGRAA